jgi:PAS domain S-box-containing protein
MLIVDNEAFDRQAIARALQQAAQIDGIEAEVLEADSIARAREVLQGEELSCVFLDHDLPDGTAADLILEVRAQGLTTPVIVLTGQRDEQTVAEVIRAGAIDYLPKEKLHPDLIALSLHAALLFQQSQRENQTILDELHTRDRAIAAASNGIALSDPSRPDCPLVYVNEAFLRMTGYSEEEVLGRNCRFLQGEDTNRSAVTELREAIRQERVCQVCFLNYRKDGSPFWNELTVSPVRNVRGDLTHFVGIQADVTTRYEADAARLQSEKALQRSQDDLRMAVEGARLGTFYCDWPLDKMVWNDIGKEHFFLPPDAEIDFDLFYLLLHPDDREPTRLAIERAMAERLEYDVEYRVLASDGRTRWFNAVGRFYYGSDGNPVRFDGITIEISARKATEEELRDRAERERFLASLAERARRQTDPNAVILDAVRSVGQFLGVSRCLFADLDLAADACTVFTDYCADESVVSMTGIFPISAFGPFLVGEYGAGRLVSVDDVQNDRVRFPPESVVAYEAVACRAFIAVPVLHSARLVSVVAVHSPTTRHWEPEEIELLQAVVERTWLTVEVLRQNRALEHEAEERIKAHERTVVILESVTDAFYAINRDWNFSYVNAQAERLLFRTREELLGRGIWVEFPEAIDGTFYHLARRVMDERIAISSEEYYAPLESWMDVRVYPSADGISVFFQNVNERKKAENERERMLAEQRARAEREALLNRIGQALRDSSDTEAAQETAAALLGEALGADRCYFALYDLEGGTVLIARDWHRADLPSIRGIHPFANTAEMFRELYQDSNTSVISDAQAASLSAQTLANVESLQIRSRISVALADAEGLAATLTAAMADGPREWTAEEVALVEDAATQLRIRVESARLQKREHRIAEQLQTALQPELPGTVPGLRVTKYYEAALTDEAGVGGDFYDVFALEKGCTVLALGDLSGKGLEAAANVSIVRNMLRAFMYSQPTVAAAVNELNRVLAENNLLTGFSTLFAGVYDSDTRILRYVNAGQEPALLRRAATGQVEQLMPTGPILGSIENARYIEEAVSLAAGDALAIFSDGLTEVGLTRSTMLGIEGVTALFEKPVAEVEAQDAAGMAEHLILRLIEEVNAAAAGGVMRDDVCLLIAVVEG